MKKEKTSHRKCPICGHTFVNKLHVLNNIDVVRCEKCKMVFADIDSGRVIESNQYQESAFFRYLEHEPKYTLVYYDHLIRKIKKHFPGKTFKVLDFGCGSGMFLKRAEKFGVEAYGLDHSPYAKLSKKYFGLEIEIEDVYKTKYQEEDFDVIISHATYEHLDDLEGITAKLLTLLKKGGLFIVSGVPNYNRITRVLANSFHMNMPPGHVNFFAKKSLSLFYKKMNLDILEVRSYGMDIWLLYNLVSKKEIDCSQESDNTLEEVKIDKQKLNAKYARDFSLRDRIITNVYSNFIIPGTGKGLDIWGVK